MLNFIHPCIHYLLILELLYNRVQQIALCSIFFSITDHVGGNCDGIIDVCRKWCPFSLSSAQLKRCTMCLSCSTLPRRLFSIRPLHSMFPTASRYVDVCSHRLCVCTCMYSLCRVQLGGHTCIWLLYHAQD